MFNHTLTEKSINAKLYMQAANSPDVNLLYLGFFRAIQSFNNATPKNEEELIESVSTGMTTIPGTRLIKHGLPYNAVSIR